MSLATASLSLKRALPALALGTLALGALAGCRDTTSSRDAASREALQRDLELAQASAVSLAQRDLPPTRFVSAIEAGEKPTAAPSAAARPSRKSPTKAPRRATPKAAPAVAAVAAEHGSQTAGSEIVAAPTTTGRWVASTESSGAPSENPTVSGPSDGGMVGSTPNDRDEGVGQGRRGHGIGGAIGGIIGVVIRGGGIGDDDHCERDHPGTARMPGMPGLPGGIGGVGGVYGGLPTRVPRSPGGIFGRRF